MGNVIFTPPSGWQSFNQTGITAYVPGDKPPAQASTFIAILPGHDFSGNFREWFDLVLAQLHKNSKILLKGDITETTDDDKQYKVLFTSVKIQTEDGNQAYRFYLGAHPGEKRAELFMFSSNSQEEYNRYFPVLKEFLGSTDFINVVEAKSNTPLSSPSPSKAKPTGNGLSGLYVGTESRQQFNVNTKFYDYIVRQIYYFFSPDGRIYYGLPKGGTLDNFDFDQAQKSDPNNCGIYQISGSQIQFRIGSNSANPPIAFSNNQGSLQIGRTKFYRVEQFSGLRLNGTYAIKTFTNTSSGSNIGGVGGEKQLVFSRDGKFAQSGFVGFSSSGNSGGVTTSSKTSGSGTYRVVGNTLELTYSDGKKVIHTFFVYPENTNEPRPGLIVIDGGAYLLRD
ncbi:MAG: hypothetical protein FD167_4560 [bacterium]|nr:MAG: hypothetical protein FD167_4560 [bacterium]